MATLTIDPTKGLKQTTNSGAVTGTNIVGGAVGFIINGALAGTGEAHQIINTGAVTGTNDVGGVVGLAGTNNKNTGTFNFKYLTNKGTVLNNSTNASSGNTGGVFGAISQDAKDSTINLSYIINDANVTSTVSATGGVIGAWQEYGKGSMTYVVNNNTSGTDVVRGTGDVGGVIGYLNDDEVTYNTGYNMATVIGTGDRVGGIVGFLNKGTLKANGDSINNSGAVTGVNQVGGIVGLIGPGGFDQVAWQTIPAIVASGTNSGISNSGKITGVTQVGGIAGANQSIIAGNANHPIINTGAVTGTDTGVLTIADTVTGGMVGGIAGNNVSNISYVINRAAVKGTTLVGGLVGCNEVDPYFGTALQQSSNTGTVTATGANAEATGGLVGYSKGIITTSYNTGAVTGVKSVGGIVGMSVPVTKDVYDSADGKWAGDAAHFWFEAQTGTSGTNLSEVYNTGTVTGTGENVGGIAGLSTGSTYTNLYNTGSVTGGTNVGGILGKGNTAFVSHIYTNDWPSVDTGETKNSVAANTLTNTYNIGAVSGTTVGGLVGLTGEGNTVTSSYYATTKATGEAINSINDSGLGTAKTLAEMKNKELYTDWDLDSVGGGTNVWRIYQRDTTPLLKNWLTPVTVKNLGNQNVDYDGLVHTPNVTGVAYDPSTVNESKILTTSGIKAGDYAMLYSTQDGYDLLEDPAFTINKLLISINLDTNAPTDYTYGASAAPIIGWGFTGFANNETYETAANYDLSATVGGVTMNKAQLTITPQEAVNAVYGDTELISKLGYNVTGLTNGDSAEVLSGTPTYTTQAWTGNKTGNAGTYKDILINGPGTLSAENYDLVLDTTTKGSVILAPASLTLTADKVTMREGDALPANFTGSISGYVNGDSATESPLFNWTGSSSSPTVGAYGIIGYLGGKSSGLYGTNYYILQNPSNNTAMSVTSRLSSSDYALAITSLVPRHGNQIVTPLYGMWVSQPAGTVGNQGARPDGKKGKDLSETSYYVDLDNQRHDLA